jgi:hypothetical protein
MMTNVCIGLTLYEWKSGGAIAVDSNFTNLKSDSDTKSYLENVIFEGNKDENSEENVYCDDRSAFFIVSRLHF